MRFIRVCRFALIAPVLAATPVCRDASAQDTAVAAVDEWPQFLGPDRNGVSRASNLVDGWLSAEGPKQLWRVPGGVGMSGLVVARGRVLTLLQADDKQVAVALDAESGRTLWQTPLAPAYRNQMGDGPRAAPAVAGDRVFVFTGEGVLAALDFADGKIFWSHRLIEQFGGKEADYGMASSPLVVDDRVIVTVGAPSATIAALDAKSGETVWKAGGDPAGYSSPALLNIGGRRQIVVYSGASVLGFAPETGAVLWRYPYVTDYECNIITPQVVDGKVFVSSGENHGAVLLELKPNGDGFDVVEAWKSQGPGSTLRTEWQTPVLIDGKLYGFDNVGSAGPVTHLTCIDAATGARLWQKLRFGKGNLIAADGKLWISTMAGELVLVRASPAGYEELARSDVGVTTRQAPALAAGRLCLRDDDEIVCFDVRK